MNIALFLEMAAEAAPDRIGLVCDSRRWTYAELHAAARGAASLISESGAAHVALLDESSEASVIALFGAAIAGVPYTPLNYRLADADLKGLLARVSPALVIGHVERAAALHAGTGDHHLSRGDFVARAEARAQDPASDVTDGNIAVQLFTSGTTAAPKAAILRHTHLVSYILGTAEFGSALEEDAVLVSVPPYHIAGVAAVLSSIYTQRRILLLPAFEPNEWIDLAARECATNAFVVPTMLQRILDALERRPNTEIISLRAIAYGGGKMPLELIERALDRFPQIEFTNAYGLTETSSTLSLLGPSDHRQMHRSTDPAVRARLTSVGKPLPTIELEIRNESGECCAIGERGEIHVRGPQVSGEYRERHALSDDGWFATRDAGWLDEEGYLFLAGRADDVIVRGGENISPGEIEDVVLSQPAIADAAAVAIPSLEWGETIGLALVLRPDCEAPSEADIKQLIKARLRSSRMPDRVIFVDALPYNEMGKLLRREVKTLFVD